MMRQGPYGPGKPLKTLGQQEKESEAEGVARRIESDEKAEAKASKEQVQEQVQELVKEHEKQKVKGQEKEDEQKAKQLQQQKGYEEADRALFALMSITHGDQQYLLVPPYFYLSGDNGAAFINGDHTEFTFDVWNYIEDEEFIDKLFTVINSLLDTAYIEKLINQIPKEKLRVVLNKETEASLSTKEKLIFEDTYRSAALESLSAAKAKLAVKPEVPEVKWGPAKPSQAEKKGAVAEKKEAEVVKTGAVADAKKMVTLQSLFAAEAAAAAPPPRRSHDHQLPQNTVVPHTNMALCIKGPMPTDAYYLSQELTNGTKLKKMRGADGNVKIYLTFSSDAKGYECYQRLLKQRALIRPSNLQVDSKEQGVGQDRGDFRNSNAYDDQFTLEIGPRILLAVLLGGNLQYYTDKEFAGELVIPLPGSSTVIGGGDATALDIQQSLTESGLESRIAEIKPSKVFGVVEGATLDVAANKKAADISPLIKAGMISSKNYDSLSPEVKKFLLESRDHLRYFMDCYAFFEEKARQNFIPKDLVEICFGELLNLLNKPLTKPTVQDSIAKYGRQDVDGYQKLLRDIISSIYDTNTKERVAKTGEQKEDRPSGVHRAYLLPPPLHLPAGDAGLDLNLVGANLYTFK